MYRKIVFIPVLIITTIVFGTIYGVAQQSLRSNANDPQVQIAEDTAAKLNNGSKPNELVTSATDPAKSLSPFLDIYDKAGKQVATSASSTHSLPPIPVGVIKASENKTYHAVTWQPTDNLRLASVTVSAHDYYVTSARSLSEVEGRESSLLWIVSLGWLMSIGVFYVTSQVVRKKI